jgi:AraC-like DNA-binding protein
MSDYRKTLMDSFESHLEQEYQAYCSRHNLQLSVSGMITFIVDRKLIPDSHIRRFAILKEFQSIFEENDRHKTLTVEALADRFNLSERTVWTILRHTENGR